MEIKKQCDWESFYYLIQDYNFSSNCFFLIKYVSLEISPLAYSFLYFFNFFSINRLISKPSSLLSLFCFFENRLKLMALRGLILPFFVTELEPLIFFISLPPGTKDTAIKDYFLSSLIHS